MFFRMSKAAARKLIAKAIEEHGRFEKEHIARMSERLAKTLAASKQQRTICVGETEFTRELGEYDRDQMIERVLGEVLKAITAEGKRPPRHLRRLVVGLA